MYHRLPAIPKFVSSQSEDLSTLSVSCTRFRIVNTKKRLQKLMERVSKVEPSQNATFWKRAVSGVVRENGSLRKRCQKIIINCHFHQRFHQRVHDKRKRIRVGVLEWKRICVDREKQNEYASVGESILLQFRLLKGLHKGTSRLDLSHEQCIRRALRNKSRRLSQALLLSWIYREWRERNDSVLIMHLSMLSRWGGGRA